MLLAKSAIPDELHVSSYELSSSGVIATPSIICLACFVTVAVEASDQAALPPSTLGVSGETAAVKVVRAVSKGRGKSSIGKQ
jgi:hypothetical protein